MPNLRRIGTWASGGRHLGSALDVLVQHQFTAAQVWLTPPSQTRLTELDDLFSVRTQARDLALFVHAPYNNFLYPPLVKHGKQMAWLKVLGHAANQINASGLVLHFGEPGEYRDTATMAARQMLDSIPKDLPVFVENAGGAGWGFKTFMHTFEALRRHRENLYIALDTAHAYAHGWTGLFEAADVQKTLALLRPYVGLLHLNNTFGTFGSSEPGEYFPIFNGNITVEQLTTVLKGLPDIPVILERPQYMQAVVDRAAVIAIDQNLTSTLEALKKSPITGARSS